NPFVMAARPTAIKHLGTGSRKHRARSTAPTGEASLSAFCFPTQPARFRVKAQTNDQQITRSHSSQHDLHRVSCLRDFLWDFSFSAARDRSTSHSRDKRCASRLTHESSLFHR